MNSPICRQSGTAPPRAQVLKSTPPRIAKALDRKTLFGFRVSSDVREFARRCRGYTAAVSTRMEQIRGKQCALKIEASRRPSATKAAAEHQVRAFRGASFVHFSFQGATIGECRTFHRFPKRTSKPIGPRQGSIARHGGSGHASTNGIGRLCERSSSATPR